MKKTNCPVCDFDFPPGNNNMLLYPSKEKNRYKPESIIFCNRCGLGVCNPMFSDDILEDYYSHSKYWKGSIPEISVRKQPVLYAMAKARWTLIESFLIQQGIRDVSLLDIGAGYGYLGIVAASSKKVIINKYTVVEPDQNIQKALSSKWPQIGSECKLEVNSSINQVKGKYEIVALSHLLEHVNDPLKLLNKAKSYMNYNGLIFIDVPNMDCNFKEDVFPHVLFFSEKSVAELLRKASMEVVFLAAFGISSDKSPLNNKAPLIIKIRDKLLKNVSRFLPSRLSESLFSFHFGIYNQNPSGTWIRAVGKQTENR